MRHGLIESNKKSVFQREGSEDWKKEWANQEREWERERKERDGVKKGRK